MRDLVKSSARCGYDPCGRFLSYNSQMENYYYVTRYFKHGYLRKSSSHPDFSLINYSSQVSVLGFHDNLCLNLLRILEKGQEYFDLIQCSMKLLGHSYKYIKFAVHLNSFNSMEVWKHNILFQIKPLFSSKFIRKIQT